MEAALHNRLWRSVAAVILPFLPLACRCHGGGTAAQDVGNVGSGPRPRGRSLARLAVVEAGVCAIVGDGVVRCWLDSAKPVMVASTPPIDELAATREGVFGRSRDGAVYLLGSSEHPFDSPAEKVAGGQAALRIAASGATLCALKSAGEVTCWRRQEASASDFASTQPTQLGVVAGAIDLTVGSTATCALDQDGQAYCVGQLARGIISEKSLSSAALAHLDGVPPLDALYLAVSSACWRSQKGDHACSPASLTADAPWRDEGHFPGWSVAAGELPLEASEIAAGPSLACARTYVETRCWGKHSRLMASEGTGEVVGVTDAKTLVVGPDSSCVLRKDSSVWCWGWGAVRSPRAIDVPYLRGVIALSVAADSICGLRASGVVGCRRLDEHHSLVDIEIPQLPDGVIALAAGRSHHCALSTQRDVSCWTFELTGNRWGELGTASFVPGVPSRVGGVKARALSLRNDRSCAITLDGGVSCWGREDYEAPRWIGEALPAASPIPRPLWTGAPVDALIATSDQGIHVIAGDQWWCERLSHWNRTHPPSPKPGPDDPRPPHSGFEAEPWARSARALLPDDPRLAISRKGAIVTSSDVLAPALGEVIDLGAGDGFRCALRVSGTVACWGANGLGELGNGSLGVTMAGGT
jgi:alpha-tubulin suppressor-like RCC1 family protein